MRTYGDILYRKLANPLYNPQIKCFYELTVKVCAGFEQTQQDFIVGTIGFEYNSSTMLFVLCLEIMKFLTEGDYCK